MSLAARLIADIASIDESILEHKRCLAARDEKIRKLQERIKELEAKHGSNIHRKKSNRGC